MSFSYWVDGRPLIALGQLCTLLIDYWADGAPVSTLEVGPTGSTVSVETLSLTCTSYAPSASTGVIATPETLHLVFTSQPLPLTGVATPETLHLVFTSQPLPLTGVATPETLHLVLTPLPFEGEVIVIIDAPLHLVLTLNTPLVTTAVSIVAQPGTLHLVFTQYGPIYVIVPISTLHLTATPKVVTVHYGVTATTFIKHLALNIHEVTVFTGVRIYETLPLTFTQLIPVLITQVVLSLSAIHLTIGTLAPIVRVSTTNVTNLLSLTISPLEASAVAGARIYETLSLVFSQLDIIINTSQTLEVGTIHLIVTPHVPLIQPSLPYSGDILHKERDWAAWFTHDNAEYADRSGAQLSPQFPLNLDQPNLTLCFWVRFKSFPATASFRAAITKTSCFSLGFTFTWMDLRLYYTNWLGWIFHDNFNPFEEDHDFRFQVNRWYHIGITVDSNSGKVYGQVWDDFLQTIVSARDNHMNIYVPHPPYRLAIGDLTLGCDPTVDSSFLDGYLDEVVIFNEIRSPMEIDAIRQGHFAGQLSGHVVSESGLKVGYNSQYKVTVEADAMGVGYNEVPMRKVESAGLMVGYKVPAPPIIPPPPIIGGLGGGGAGEGTIDFCHLSYKFKTDVFAFDFGTDQEDRFDTFSLPVQHLEASLGSSDQGAYFHMVSVFRSGAQIFSAPVWALRTTITGHARAGQTSFEAVDVSNFNVNENAILMRSGDTSIFDMVTVTGITGNTVFFSEALQHHYHQFRMPSITQSYDERSSYAAPCITGVVDIEDHGLKGPRPFYYVKVKVDGGVWPAAIINPEVPSFLEVPLSAAYIAPRIEKTIVGADVGIMELMPHASTARLAFELEWSFIDIKWKLLRSLFFATKGRAKTFHIPTWVFELEALTDALEGATLIHLHDGYASVYPRFPQLYFVSGRNSDRFIVTVNGSLGDGWYSCEPLESAIFCGDRACFYPQVRFLEDELIFEFLDIGKCAAKVSFIEVLP